MNLIINDYNHGPIRRCKQDRGRHAWVFSMESGIDIYVPFRRIIWFDGPNGKDNNKRLKIITE